MANKHILFLDRKDQIEGSVASTNSLVSNLDVRTVKFKKLKNLKSRKTFVQYKTT